MRNLLTESEPFWSHCLSKNFQSKYFQPSTCNTVYRENTPCVCSGVWNVAWQIKAGGISGWKEVKLRKRSRFSQSYPWATPPYLLPVIYLVIFDTGWDGSHIYNHWINSLIMAAVWERRDFRSSTCFFSERGPSSRPGSLPLSVICGNRQQPAPAFSLSWRWWGSMTSSQLPRTAFNVIIFIEQSSNCSELTVTA